MGLFDSSVASMLLSNSFQQSRITSYMGPLSLPFHLPLSFLVLSFLHPILFAIASVEVAKRRFPFTLYSAIQIIFSLSIVIAATSNLFEMWKLVEVRGASYLDTRELLKKHRCGCCLAGLVLHLNILVAKACHSLEG